jgi:hypothetical protein
MLRDLIGTESPSGKEGNVGHVLNGWLRGFGLAVR